jgi:glutamate dehydrogenase
VTKKLTAFLSAADLAALAATESRLTAEGVPLPLATSVARLDALYAALDIVEISRESNRGVELAAAVYFALVGNLNLRWVAGQVATLPAASHWQTMARAAMRDDLANLQRQLTMAVLAHSPSLSDAASLLAAWQQHLATPLLRLRELIADLQGAKEADLAQMSVLLRELRVLV